ncbi:hypothetical protein AMS68_003195 [Peltaster fructicola]|uniref:5-Methylcytosine G/T mismatch-specific DNA glycosylase n=1 Tax=Peltaster fructicola TaxID=286661 RepID=A0A6H0XST3_9PEZI|nr:hypothetical protein AMS68_003195 [Peltaster fructicola]
MPMGNYPNPSDDALPVPRCAPYSPTDMPVTSSSPRPREDPNDKPRRRRKEYDYESSDKLPRSSKHKYSSSTSLSSGRKISSNSTRRRSNSRERYSDDKSGNREGLRASPTGNRKPGVSEMDHSIDGADDRPRSGYPTFSKAHSREAVGSREHISEPSITSDEKEKRRNSTPIHDGVKPQSSTERLSDPRARSRSDLRDHVLRPKASLREEDGMAKGSPRSKTVKSSASGASLRRDAQFGASEVSSMPGAFPDENEVKSTPTSSYRRTVSTSSQPPSNLTQTTEETIDSQATSVAHDRKYTRTAPPVIPVDDSSPPSATDSFPKTPTPSEPYFPPSAKATPVYDVGARWEIPSTGRTPMAAFPPPPPPPPPMAGPAHIPRVDYLLKHGGLPYAVTRRLVQSNTASPAQYSAYHSPDLAQTVPLEQYSKVFSGIVKRLDDYMQVLRLSGSIAVATGYRSVARRLLDKLSQVFARDISSQRCDCVMCRTIPQPHFSDEEDSGISWGEILEAVSGRSELPQWPPFLIQPTDTGLGIDGTAQAPMQKIDIDVPEEYREHYKRQNQKTKLAVQSWLEQQPGLHSSPPDEADEDTLMFAMMTKLTTQERNLFIALMHGQSSVSDVRAPTPAERPTTSSQTLKRSRSALQRLYRLERPPRDCESAMYLLNNPQLHGMLATLAEVNEQEWDILISGRFDGFLWSGAETQPSAAAPSISRMPSRNANASPLSRNTTPFSGLSGIPSRGSTPFGSSPLRNVMSPDAFAGHASALPSRMATPAFQPAVNTPAPVQFDEETEIGVLAEVERNIFCDMERLEDAFEALHSRAEEVRQALRERSAGLSLQAQMRRGANGYDPGVRLDTPASGFTNFEDEEDDDGLGDTASLAPDDSASQISFNRRVRKRRERQTPAPVEEEDETEGGAADKERVKVEKRRDGRRSVKGR